MKDKLLIIAPHLPHYDENSGDLRLFSIIEILSKSYDILYFTQANMKNKLADDKYVGFLKELGVNVLFSQEYSIKDILQKNKFKAAILEFYFIVEYYLPRIRILQPDCRVIVDTVDVHYIREMMKSQITRNQVDFKKAEETKRRELAVYKKADVVITVTEEDARILENDGLKSSLKIIPNIHNLVLSQKTPEKNKLIFVGGFSHDPNVDAVLYFCKDVLPLIRKEVPNIHFTIVGSNPPQQIKELKNEFINVMGYVPCTALYLHSSYVSVAPLRYGAGMKGKVGEAMAHGVPVVTTAVGAQGMGLVNRENVMLADSAEDFSCSVLELVRNENLYRTIRNNAIQYISNNYTPIHIARMITSVLDSLDDFPLRKMYLSEKIVFIYSYMRGIANKKLKLA